MAEKVFDVVGEDGHSEEFLAADAELLKFFSRDMPKSFEDFAHRAFPGR